MRDKQAQEIQGMLSLRIKDVFRATIHFHLTCDEHIKEIGRVVHNGDAYKRLPQWRRAYLAGINDTLWSLLYESNMGHKAPLEWVLIGPNGRQFREGNDDWLKESDEYKQALSGTGARSTHAWRDALDKGEFKPW
jgi:hypothetical protein